MTVFEGDALAILIGEFAVDPDGQDLRNSLCGASLRCGRQYDVDSFQRQTNVAAAAALLVRCMVYPSQFRDPDGDYCGQGLGRDALG